LAARYAFPRSLPTDLLFVMVIVGLPVDSAAWLLIEDVPRPSQQRPSDPFVLEKGRTFHSNGT